MFYSYSVSICFTSARSTQRDSPHFQIHVVLLETDQPLSSLLRTQRPASARAARRRAVDKRRQVFRSRSRVQSQFGGERTRTPQLDRRASGARHFQRKTRVKHSPTKPARACLSVVKTSCCCFQLVRRLRVLRRRRSCQQGEARAAPNSHES